PERKHADIPEVGVDPLAVGHRRLGGKAVLQMVRALRLTPMHLPRPADLAGFEVDAVHHPAMLAGRWCGSASVQVNADPRLLLIDHRNNRGDEDAVTPDDRRAPAEPWDVGLPGNVFRLAPA